MALDDKVLREAKLKQRYCNMIVKSQKQILGDSYDEEEMEKKVRSWERELREDKEEKAKSREKDREAARIAIASMKRTVYFDDALQAERDFLAIIGSTLLHTRHFLDPKSYVKFSAALVRIAIMGEVEAYPALLLPLQSEEGFSFRFKVSAL
uniref:Uncharacterized protein n=1 Tax=Solanum lycopersicum TaxID=4081 RepID=K4B0E5_SOLLC